METLLKVYENVKENLFAHQKNIGVKPDARSEHLERRKSNFGAKRIKAHFHLLQEGSSNLCQSNQSL